MCGMFIFFFVNRFLISINNLSFTLYLKIACCILKYYCLKMEEPVFSIFTENDKIKINLEQINNKIINKTYLSKT